MRTFYPRSFADKLLDRNAGIILATEGPIDDTLAYRIGTEIYKELSSGSKIIKTLHKDKKAARDLDEKATALAYTLLGNPNISINF